MIPDAAYNQIVAALLREAERLQTSQSDGPRVTASREPSPSPVKGLADESYPDDQTRAS
jgi:hypothetical protein